MSANGYDAGAFTAMGATLADAESWDDPWAYGEDDSDDEPVVVPGQPMLNAQRKRTRCAMCARGSCEWHDRRRS